MRISDWSSDVCSSDLARDAVAPRRAAVIVDHAGKSQPDLLCDALGGDVVGMNVGDGLAHRLFGEALRQDRRRGLRSEEHTSELQSLMRISYAVFCLQKKTNRKQHHKPQQTQKQHNSQK